LLYKNISKRFKDLGLKLREARMPLSPEEYVKQTVVLSLYLSIAVSIITFLFTKKPASFLAFPLLLALSFFYLIHRVDVVIKKKREGINKEIIYAGRFLMIELESGVPVYQAFKNLAENYPVLGEYFQDVVRSVEFGTPLEDALEKAINNSPSPELRRVLWQLLNSLKTGADVLASLNAVLDQVVREQQIQVKEYGRKLNPLAMFYMMAAIILPSLGTTMLIVLATFIGFTLPLSALLIIVGLLGFLQFMFLAIIKSSRPPMAI